ncbi:CaiB/BaiF CoA transferase family protein [Streptomyces sp. NPDC050145]|uniref:CaiB/BaiF CoA transferase family protein n=1 Tax=Streptomyces sp. NPDC050145 TaxID=3365602 RepID=UPI00379DB4EE
MTSTDSPLSGITVLDLSHIYAAPYTTLMMAQAGARVIKVEPPTGGEHLRKRGTIPGPRYAFAMMNAGKESLTLDLKHPEGPSTLRALVRRADVLVENFRPGTMDRLGVGWDKLKEENPRLIYAQSSGYGSTGPYAEYPAMDLSVQAMSGLVSVTGHPDGDPVKAGVAVCDISAGMNLYGAVTTALFQRERTGKGMRVEVSMMESVFPMLMSSVSTYYATGEIGPRTGNRHPGMSVAPYNIFPANDGHVVVICESDHHWSSLTKIMNRPELATDKRYVHTKERAARMDEVDAIVTEWTSGRGKEEVFRELVAVGIPGAPVRDLADVATDVHLQERGFLHTTPHPELGDLTAMGSPLELGDSPRRHLHPARALGEDTAQVGSELLGEEMFQKLAGSGVFGIE